MKVPTQPQQRLAFIRRLDDMRMLAESAAGLAHVGVHRLRTQEAYDVDIVLTKIDRLKELADAMRDQ